MFSQEFIEQTREAQGDEAAAELMAANRRESHAARLSTILTNAETAKTYPYAVYAMKEKGLEMPTFDSDDQANTWLQQQDGLFKAMGAQLPGQQQQQQPEPQQQQQQQQAEPDPTQPRQQDPTVLGQRKGMIPWSQDATEASNMHPLSPGQTVNEGQVVVAEVEDLMDPPEGQFRRGRERDFQMIKGMEIANSIDGGTQELRRMRERHEDPDIFPI